MFRDELALRVKAGDGGAGCVALRREKYVPRGGPIGGDGGKGGDVVFAADGNYNTLYHLTHQPRFAAESGRPGDSKGGTGRSGRDLLLLVPPGTRIWDHRTGALLKDLEAAGQRVVVCRGGKGGRGNRRFATPTRQTPRFAEPGRAGEARRLRLELRMIADVGFIGMPNAGKSTLLSRLSAARPRVAAYPFTTITPNLGILKGDDARTCVLADLPGLIEGAHAGKGLGDQFLRHIERTRLLLHLVDVTPVALKPPEEAYRLVRREIESYSPVLAAKPEIVVATKMDATSSRRPLTTLAKVVREVSGGEVWETSAVTGRGVPELARRLFNALERMKGELEAPRMM
ncbi:MAG: GTPase ObgE [Planctomycetes bacterium]|nr:GTPase ObgE [Planctomycetota bacterium]